MRALLKGISQNGNSYNDKSRQSAYEEIRWDTLFDFD